MPPISAASIVTILVTRSNATAANATGDALQVICAWPVSGQYGPGSRVLYYVLVAACVFARKVAWMRNACLAAALLFPAVAAIHGIVLAAVPTPGAVDMDVFGAFQLCAIGILAAPVTVKVSQTYFNDPGRNAIFMWTTLLLAGLLSLTVQFFRTSSTPCMLKESESEFIYGTTMCGLICSVDDGPFSPMRGGSANDIYVIPAPDRLTFGTATLLSAACCVPAILSLISMWNKILEINWKRLFGDRHEEEEDDMPIEGTNGATDARMNTIKSQIRKIVKKVEIPLFGAGVLAILIIGERNFFSTQVRYQTEPIASVGQWAPIAGTALAVMGSLYLLAVADEAGIEEKPKSVRADSAAGTSVVNEDVGTDPPTPPIICAGGRRPSFSEVHETLTQIDTTTTHSGLIRSQTVASTITQKFRGLTTPKRELFNDEEFRTGAAIGFPTTPGENFKNPNLEETKRLYEHGNNRSRSRSRAASFTSGTTPRAGSPHRYPSPSPSPSRRERASSELHSPTSQPTRVKRRDTLEVPVVHHSHSITMPESPTSPTIVVSQEPTPPEPAFMTSNDKTL